MEQHPCLKCFLLSEQKSNERCINQFKPVQQSRQKTLRAYCPNIYCAVGRCVKDRQEKPLGSDKSLCFSSSTAEIACLPSMLPTSLDFLGIKLKLGFKFQIFHLQGRNTVPAVLDFSLEQTLGQQHLQFQKLKVELTPYLIWLQHGNSACTIVT